MGWPNTLWCRSWGCRNTLNPIVGCSICSARMCNEHVGLHWEKCHKPAKGG